MAKSTQLKAVKAQELSVTPLKDLEAYSHGQVVELPPFAEGQPFVARIRRPSMLAMMKSGRIPNSLLSTASKLFNGDVSDEEDDNSMSKLFEVLELVADACLMEPTLGQLKECGMELSDDQYMFIFNYTQRGVKALESFR